MQELLLLILMNIKLIENKYILALNIYIYIYTLNDNDTDRRKEVTSTERE